MKASAPSTRANSAESGGALHGGKVKPLSFEAFSKSISSFWDKTRTESGSVSFLMGAVSFLGKVVGVLGLLLISRSCTRVEGCGFGKVALVGPKASLT